MFANYILIILSTVIVNNLVLMQFLGLCPFFGVSSKRDLALGMGIATTFVLTLSSTSGYLINTYILLPFDLTHLRTLSFIFVIAAVVQLTEMLMRATSPLLHRMLGIFLPLITTNCAVLGVALLNARQARTLIESMVYGFGAALGFTLVLLLFATLRERTALSDVPKLLQGSPIALITAGIMSLAFMGFSGLGAT